MVLYPFLANLLFVDDPVRAGMFLGTAIHDTAQVTGAALIHGQMFDMSKVVYVATVTKLTRNIFIIVIIPFVSYLFFKERVHSQSEQTSDVKTNTPKWYTFIPLFVIGFLALSLVRTVGDATLLNNVKAFGLFDPDTWESIYTKASSFGTTYLLGMAM